MWSSERLPSGRGGARTGSGCCFLLTFLLAGGVGAATLVGLGSLAAACSHRRERVGGGRHGQSVTVTSRLSSRTNLRYSHLPAAAALGERVESRLKKLQTLLVCLKTGGADRKCSLQEEQRRNQHCDQTVEN